MIYLDFAATNPVRPQVAQLIYDNLADHFGNASSIYRIGKSNKVKLIQARNEMAKMLQIEPSQLFFTSGATEANNWAIFHQAHQSRQLGLGNHIVSTSIEHPSVMEVLSQLESEGFEVTYLNPNIEATYTVDMFQAASHNQTIGWVSMAVNNEVGSVLPIKELGQIAQSLGLWYHVDSVQAIGHIPMSEIAPYCTSFVGSAHKFGGPKGIGFLAYQVWNSELTLKPYIFGGGQESHLRSGTENLAYILGMTEALKLTLAEFDEQYQRAVEFRKLLVKTLEAHQISFTFNGDPDHFVPHIINVWFHQADASQLLIKLDLADIFVSAGSACSAGTVTDSKILKAYYPQDSERWHQSLRISTGYTTQIQDIEILSKQLIKLLEGK